MAWDPIQLQWLSFLVLIVQLSFAVFFFYLCLAFITGAPFVPSTNATAAKMIELAHLKSGMRVYDLGSGEGRLLFLAAEKHATAVGVEINPFLVLFTRLRILLSSHGNRVSVRWQDLWKVNVRDADVVFVYLLPWRMKKLQSMLTGQLKKGTKVVSNSFIFPDWTITDQDAATHVYVFTVT